MELKGLQQVLIYNYLENAVEVRAPYREEHLALVAEWEADGRLVAGGATGDPPSGALIVLRGGEDAQAFVDADPYVQNGVVTDWRVEPWNVV
jgi:uncharacterized protein YciI